MPYSAGISDPLISYEDLQYPGNGRYPFPADVSVEGQVRSDYRSQYLGRNRSPDDKIVVLKARRLPIENAEELALINLLSNADVLGRSNFKIREKALLRILFKIKDRVVATGRFKPSAATAGFLARGFEAFEELASESDRPQEFEIIRKAVPEETLTLEEFGEIITVRLERMFSTIGFRAQARDHSSVPLTFRGRFHLRIQYEILDRLFTRPDESGDFLRSLLIELRDFVSHGGHVGGDWGKLIVDSNELMMSILPSDTAVPENWEMPTKVDVT